MALASQRQARRGDGCDGWVTLAAVQEVGVDSSQGSPFSCASGRQARAGFGALGTGRAGYPGAAQGASGLGA